GEVVVDQAHHFGAQALQIREVLRVDDAELLAEHAIAHLDGGPGGEVVRVAAGEARLVQEAAVGVEVDAVERHLLQLLEQLALVVGAPAEHLAQLPAAEEVEGGAGAALAHASSGATARRAQSAATVAPARTSGGLACHHPSACTCAEPRSSCTPAASASSRRASASAAPRGRSRRRSSSTCSRAEASQAAGSTAPGPRAARR